MKIMRAVVLLMCSVAVAQSPADYNNRGIEAYEAGSYEEAVTWFERALDLTPENDVVRRNLCNARQGIADQLARAGDFAAAAANLERAIAADPENPSPLVQMGVYYLRLDMVPEAIRRLEEAIELKPGHLDAHEFLGEAYYRDNDLPSARAQWDYVLGIEPNRPGLRERYEKAFREESIEAEFKKTNSSHFKLSAPREIPYHVRNRVMRLLEEAYREIGRKFGGEYPPGPIQVILYDADQFNEATQMDEHVGAVYDGKIRAPMTGKDGQWLPDEELQRRLTHEYVHVVARFLAGENIPWWLNEGLAETFSDELGADKVEMLRNARAAGALYTLAELEPSQLKARSPETLRIAYLQAHLTVRHLWDRFGQRRLRDMMSALASGVPPEQALRENYRRTYDTLLREVLEQVN